MFVIYNNFIVFYISRSWAVATNLFWAAVISVTFPRMVGAFGNVGAFGFYAGMNICALIMIFFLMPGTDCLFSSINQSTIFSLTLSPQRNETTNAGRIRLCFRCPNEETYILSSQDFPSLLDSTIHLFQESRT